MGNNTFAQLISQLSNDQDSSALLSHPEPYKWSPQLKRPKLPQSHEANSIPNGMQLMK